MLTTAFVWIYFQITEIEISESIKRNPNFQILIPSILNQEKSEIWFSHTVKSMPGWSEPQNISWSTTTKLPETASPSYATYSYTHSVSETVRDNPYEKSTKPLERMRRERTSPWNLALLIAMGEEEEELRSSEEAEREKRLVLNLARKMNRKHGIAIPGITE